MLWGWCVLHVSWSQWQVALLWVMYGLPQIGYSVAAAFLPLFLTRHGQFP